jgi:hypothetical protein
MAISEGSFASAARSSLRMHRMMFSWAPSGDFLCHQEQMLCDRLYFTWEIVERPKRLGCGRS